jgi:L-amino acid N-acyltransferase
VIAIRNAEENDLEQILEIYNDAIIHSTAVFQYDPQTIEARKEWFYQKQKDKQPVFVATADTAILGFSTFGMFRNWQAYQYTVENSVYVKADERGKGLGKLLMLPLINAAKERKLHTIVAGIVADNNASISLHKQFGFTEVAYFKEVAFKFDRWLDLIFMQLIL